MSRSARRFLVVAVVLLGTPWLWQAPGNRPARPRPASSRETPSIPLLAAKEYPPAAAQQEAAEALPEPVAEAATPAAGADAAPVRSRAVTRRMTVTAYCPCALCCGASADGVTASGQSVSANGGCFVAADRSIPFGAKVSVPGYHDGLPVPVLDRGGGIRGDRLDVFFPSHATARNWGKRRVDVTFYE